MKKACTGSISVFFSVSFLFVLAFLGSLYMFARQQLVQISIRKDMDQAAFSALGEYSNSWVREYGIYIMPRSDIEADLRFFMNQNSQHGWGRYELIDLSVSNVKTLDDQSVLRDQILFFMKERGVLGLVEEMADSLFQVKETNEEVEKKVDWKNSEELMWIQNLYAQLVTDVEGIQEDGSYASYSINHFLDQDPSLAEVIAAVQSGDPTSHEVGILERAYYELEQVEALCIDAAEIAKDLGAALARIENPDKLPFTSEQLQNYSRIWKQNQQLCHQTSQALKEWIGTLETEGQNRAALHQSAIQSVGMLKSYDSSIDLPYEYKKSQHNWNFSQILSYLKGYSENVGEIAPDVELNLGLDGKESSEEQELNEILGGESFQNTVLLTEYVLGIFQNFQEANDRLDGKNPLNLRGEEKQNRFLTNEVEYLLQGKENEYQNVNGTRQKIVALRTAMNMLYLLKDSVKRAEIEAMAAAIGGILLPGIGNGILFGVILTVWSMGEAIVDYRLLIDGGKVPLFKGDADWKTDLSTILSMEVTNESEKQETGLAYHQYLRFLLYMVDQETLLQRIQNLLYLNHQRQSLAEAVTCFSIEGIAKAAETEWSFSGEYGYALAIQ